MRMKKLRCQSQLCRACPNTAGRPIWKWQVIQGEFHPNIHPSIRHSLVLGFSRLKPVINVSTSCFTLKSWRGNSSTDWRSSSQCQVSNREAAGRRWNDYLRVWNDQQCLNSLHSSVPAVLHLWHPRTGSLSSLSPNLNIWRRFCSTKGSDKIWLK